MHTKTLSELSALLQAKQISATELAKLFLKRIGDSQLNAFLHVDESLTLKQAELADERLAFDGRLENSGELHQSVQRYCRTEIPGCRNGHARQTEL